MDWLSQCASRCGLNSEPRDCLPPFMFLRVSKLPMSTYSILGPLYAS